MSKKTDTTKPENCDTPPIAISLCDTCAVIDPRYKGKCSVDEAERAKGVHECAYYAKAADQRPALEEQPPNPTQADVLADEFYADATDEITPQVVETITRFHPHLKAARIKYFYDLAEECETVGKGQWMKRVLAKIRKPTGLLRTCSQADFIVTIHAGTWESMSPAQRFALIDHELTHAQFSDGKWFLIPHDLEEFPEMVLRHGFITAAIQRFARAVQAEFEFMHGQVEARKEKE